jgi:hypothetical protein
MISVISNFASTNNGLGNYYMINGGMSRGVFTNFSFPLALPT